MARRTLTVSEARRQLPRLIQQVTRGGGPFYLGSRGQPTAVLVSAEQWEMRATSDVVSEGLGAWEPLRLEIVGDPADLEKDIRAIRDHAVDSSLASWERAASRDQPAPKAPRKRRARP